MGTRTRRGVTFLTLCVVTLLLMPAGAAFAQQEDESAGADLEGCVGSAESTDDEGNPVDTVSAPGGPGSSPDNPFVVDYDGEVTYEGTTDSVITDHSWEIRLYGAPVKTGGSENADQETEDSDSIQVDDYLPFKVVGLYYVSGDLTGEGGECTGNMWVEIEGSPIGTVGWFLGLFFLLLGLYLLFKSLPTAAVSTAPVASEPPPPTEDE